ncbi:MAG: SagB/ThcOx family dehydrogenase [Candidatus Xenobium sp.]|jgi:SagB-type dehydrogenase family enzyme|nr:SagB/ThcOx family dehydrogenase [Burkholderiales bacterium]
MSENPDENFLLELPPPRSANGSCTLELALSRRRSRRDFQPTPLKPEQIGQLAWACQGLSDPRGLRTAPSAGALHPLGLRIVTPEGLGEYLPESHALQIRSRRDLRAELTAACPGQDWPQRAPAIFALSADPQRVLMRYGTQRTERYLHLEAGHAAQNLLLQAIALELWATPLAAFDDARVSQTLGLPEGHLPLYLIPVGVPLRQPGRP